MQNLLDYPTSNIHTNQMATTGTQRSKGCTLSFLRLFEDSGSQWWPEMAAVSATGKWSVVVTKTWKQPKCPSIGECIKKMWHLYTDEYY